MAESTAASPRRAGVVLAIGVLTGLVAAVAYLAGSFGSLAAGVVFGLYYGGLFAATIGGALTLAGLLCAALVGRRAPRWRPLAFTITVVVLVEALAAVDVTGSSSDVPHRRLLPFAVATGCALAAALASLLLRAPRTSMKKSATGPASAS